MGAAPDPVKGTKCVNWAQRLSAMVGELRLCSDADKGAVTRAMASATAVPPPATTAPTTTAPPPSSAAPATTALPRPAP